MKDENRCAVCGWPLDPTGRMCQRGNCSMRPLPRRFYDSTRVAAEYGMYAPAELDPYVPPPDRAAQDRAAVRAWLERRIAHYWQEADRLAQRGIDSASQLAAEHAAMLERERDAMREGE